MLLIPNNTLQQFTPKLSNYHLGLNDLITFDSSELVKPRVPRYFNFFPVELHSISRSLPIIDHVSQRESGKLRSTCRAKNPSFSAVLTWVTMLSSTQRTVMGTFAPHLSHIADIPHFTPITPVRREVGPMTPAWASMIRPPPPPPASSSSEWETMGSAEKRREGGRRGRRGPPPAERERPRRRASRPLDAAAMVAAGDGRRGAARWVEVERGLRGGAARRGGQCRV